MSPPHHVQRTKRRSAHTSQWNSFSTFRRCTCNSTCNNRGINKQCAGTATNHTHTHTHIHTHTQRERERERERAPTPPPCASLQALPYRYFGELGLKLLVLVHVMHGLQTLRTKEREWGEERLRGYRGFAREAKCHVHTDTHTHTYTHTCTDTHRHKHTHKQTKTHTLTNTQSNTIKHMHKQTQTHTKPHHHPLSLSPAATDVRRGGGR